MARGARWMMVLFGSLVGCGPPEDAELEQIVMDWYDDEGPFAGTYEMAEVTCLSSEKISGSEQLVDVGYAFCPVELCPLRAGWDNRQLVVAKESGAWQVVSEGDFLDGSCAEGATTSAAEDDLIAGDWRWTDMIDQLTGERTAGTGDLWTFAPTSEGNGAVLFNGASSGEQWFLSEVPYGEWTLQENYEWYVVFDSDQYLPFSYGLRQVDGGVLELHHDVGLGLSRVDRFEAAR